MKPFHLPQRFEIAYENAIQRLLAQFFKIPSFANLQDVQDTLTEYQGANKFLQGFATQLAARMITGVAVQNARSWREAATQASNGRVIYEMLKREMQGPLRAKLLFLIHENAQYISTVPTNIAVRATRYIQQETMKGRRSESIVKDITPYMRDLRAFEVRRIARTEVAKADTAITRTRAEDIGLNWYVWATSHDARVRDSHHKMDQVLVNWSDPPSPEELIGLRSRGHYHAGNIYNCRCVALPLVSFGEVTFPVKVYRLGRIERMSKRQFAIIADVPLREAA